MNRKRSNTSISSPLEGNISSAVICGKCDELKERHKKEKKEWDERHQIDDQFNKCLWEHREGMAKEYSKIQKALIQKYEADAYSMKLQIQDLEERLEMSEAKNERLLLRRMEDREKMRTKFEGVGKKIEKNDGITTTTAEKTCTNIVEESEFCQNCFELNKEMLEQEMELIKKHQEKVDQLDQKLEEYKSQKEEEVRDMQLASLELELKIELLMEEIKKYEEEEKLRLKRQDEQVDGWHAIAPFNPYKKRNPEAKILALEETIKVFKRETDLLRVYLEANTTEVRSLEDRLREEKRTADEDADYYEAKIERLYTRLDRKNERIAELENSSSGSSDDDCSM